MTHSPNVRATFTIAESASRSGMNRVWLVSSRSKNQPMWAWKNPRATASGDVPCSHGECGSPSRSENAWWRRWSATQFSTLPWIANDPEIAIATRSHFFALNDLCVKCRWNPTVTPRIAGT